MLVRFSKVKLATLRRAAVNTSAPGSYLPQRTRCRPLDWPGHAGWTMGQGRPPRRKKAVPKRPNRAREFAKTEGELMSGSVHIASLAAVGSDAQVEFEPQTDPFRHELLVHCYRILGSFDDAEDALQETLLRAWRQFDSLRSHASLRAWLYKIATNVSLNMLESRRVRSMPTLMYAPANPQDPLKPPITEPVWLDLLPDEYVTGDSLSPESRYEMKESVSLAFLTALQRLPGRQRAILILRDVLDWTTEEIADLLDQSAPAVNSALQRARATMKKYHDKAELRGATPDDKQVAALLARFMRAWEASDAAKLVALLSEDAILTMPPLPAWYRGRASIEEFLDLHVFSVDRAGKQFRVAQTRANGFPAIASYQLDEAGIYRPGAILLLAIENDQVIQLDDFLALTDRLFLRFKLPLSL
jgi:RNA polymerase sigma-70 factor, ECF subfamily